MTAVASVVVLMGRHLADAACEQRRLAAAGRERG
jgi:hypothetical protein